MEKGFFHKDVGYWQTNSTPSAETIASYPNGTVEVPLIPSSNHSWNGEKWVEVPTNLDELASSVRHRRNQMLASSDWTQVADAPVEQSAWAAYRQVLRDITAQLGFPEQINWPEAPQ
jgi:hypothetical protein